jgi:hypothetical protein
LKDILWENIGDSLFGAGGRDSLNSSLAMKRERPGVVRRSRAFDAICAVMLGEIQRGEEMTRARDPAKAREIEIWADKLETRSPSSPSSPPPPSSDATPASCSGSRIRFTRTR